LAKKKNIEKAQHEMTHRQLSRHKKAQRRQRIIFFSGLAIILAVVLIIISGWFMGEYVPLHKTIVEVNGVGFSTAYLVDTLVFMSKSSTATSLSSLASEAANQIAQQEVVKQEAAKLGITVSNEEARQYLESAGYTVNDATIDIVAGSMLLDKLKKEHFSPLVPASENQVYIKAMMVESESLAQVVRDKLLNGGNFTLLNNEYATNAASKANNGDYNWHTQSILKSLVGSDYPLNWAFGKDSKAGDISQPIIDKVSSKQLGYWLIRINERLDEDTANVSALLLSSEDEAQNIRTRLLAGESLKALAGNYSQYTVSSEQGGELGLIFSSNNITNVFNKYVFTSANTTPTELGVWSQPIRENKMYTPGGAWVVQLIGKEADRALSTEDKDSLISTAINTWFSDAWTAASGNVNIDLTSDLTQFVINKATAIINSGQK
jgi:parvulin-like peptidyl-prolyl isomerase